MLIRRAYPVRLPTSQSAASKAVTFCDEVPLGDPWVLYPAAGTHDLKQKSIVDKSALYSPALSARVVYSPPRPYLLISTKLEWAFRISCLLESRIS